MHTLQTGKHISKQLRENKLHNTETIADTGKSITEYTNNGTGKSITLDFSLFTSGWLFETEVLYSGMGHTPEYQTSLV